MTIVQKTVYDLLGQICQTVPSYPTNCSVFDKTVDKCVYIRDNRRLLYDLECVHFQNVLINQRFEK